ncbi:hypothetical protein BXY70_1786 [Roseovarius halotolerans]|uniref:Uncharacterized protein n=1 Tax=Roseovarius halotolerans TaxID=505353 RepID=A0A1X6Z1J5_9RHOB|nr:hypothetical protein [Roseovarius halotolerans]RKT32450.1 hypothetical protein BXY70_1786 [Roseovarius halotolerans]SLN37207.1 hypothetical protein ROH8110_01921 [Roseovarius halotolerans]
MKPVLTALVIMLSAGPVLAFGIGTETLTPTLSFPSPDPAPAPVTQTDAGINK